MRYTGIYSNDVPVLGPQLRCGTHVPDLGYADDFALAGLYPC